MAAEGKPDVATCNQKQIVLGECLTLLSLLSGTNVIPACNIYMQMGELQELTEVIRESDEQTQTTNC